MPQEEGPAYLAITLRSMQIRHALNGADKNRLAAAAADKILSAGDKNCPTCKRCSVAVGGNWEKQARHGTAGHDMANSGDPLVHLSPCRLKLCPSKIMMGPKRKP